MSLPHSFSYSWIMNERKNANYSIKFEIQEKENIILHPTDFHQIHVGPWLDCLPNACLTVCLTVCLLTVWLSAYWLSDCLANACLTACPQGINWAQLSVPVSPLQDSKAATPGVKPSHLLCITVEEVGGPTTTTPPSPPPSSPIFSDSDTSDTLHSALHYYSPPAILSCSPTVKHDQTQRDPRPVIILFNTSSGLIMDDSFICSLCSYHLPLEKYTLLVLLSFK